MWMMMLMAGLAAVGVMWLADEASGAERWRVYLGTGSKEGSKGVYLAELDLTTGRLSEPKLAAEAGSPGFLAMHPSRRWLYSVGAMPQAEGGSVGVVYAFEVDAATGGLTLLNHQPVEGRDPCHLTVDPSGKGVLAACYGSGSVSVLPIEADGRLAAVSCVMQHEGSSVNERRQKGPHAHSVQVHRSGRYAFAADLGTDQLLVYRYDSEAGKLELDEAGSYKATPGAGPRHFAFHPTLELVYLINELDSTVTVLQFDVEAGRLTELQRVPTLPGDFADTNYPSEVAVHPSGRFLYGANRGHDSLAVYRIDAATGELEAAGHVSVEGRHPRHFAIDPTGQLLIVANMHSHELTVFRVDAETGEPSFTGQRVALGSPMAVLYEAVE